MPDCAQTQSPWAGMLTPKRPAAVYKKAENFIPCGYISCHVARQTKEERLRSELQCPNADFLYAALAYRPVVENVASEGIVHLHNCQCYFLARKVRFKHTSRDTSSIKPLS